MKSMFITEDGRIVTSDPMHADEVINMVTSATLNALTNILKQIPEEHQADAKKEMYDMYNIAASSFLKVFAPEFALRPDLTEEAIMQAENQILTERAAAIKTEEVLIPLNSLDENGKPVKSSHPHLTEVK